VVIAPSFDIVFCPHEIAGTNSGTEEIQEKRTPARTNERIRSRTGRELIADLVGAPAPTRRLCGCEKEQFAEGKI
jgi:hypothetical protein